MRSTLLLAFMLVSSLMYAQQSTNPIDVTSDYQSDIKQGNYDKIAEELTEKVVRNAVESLGADCDPFGAFVVVKLAMQDQNNEDSTVGTLPYGRLALIVGRELYRDQRFYTIPGSARPHKNKNTFVYLMGLYPTGSINSVSFGYDVTGYNYTYKRSINGKTKMFTLTINCQITVEKPRNGSISGVVYFHGENGELAWDKTPRYRGMDKTNAWIDCIRLDPGTDHTNSFNKPLEWYPIDIAMDREGFYTVEDLNPGIYYPVVKFRGCIQHLNTKDEQFILRTESRPNWGHLFSTGKPAKLAKAEDIYDFDIHTQFSLNNTLSGDIRDEKGKLVNTPLLVHLETQFPTDDPKLQDLTTTSKNGRYIFENVASGIYSIWIDGKENKKETVSICNEPQLGYKPNDQYEFPLLVKAPKVFFLVMETKLKITKLYDVQYSGELGFSPMGAEKMLHTGSKILMIGNYDEIYYGELAHNTFKETFPMYDKCKMLNYQSEYYVLDLKEGRWVMTSNSEPDVSSWTGSDLQLPYLGGQRLYQNNDTVTFDPIVNEERFGFTEGFSKASLRTDDQQLKWSDIKNIGSPKIIKDMVILETQYKHEFNISQSDTQAANLQWLSDKSKGQSSNFFKALDGKNTHNIEPSKQIYERTITLRPATQSELRKYLPSEYFSRFVR